MARKKPARIRKRERKAVPRGRAYIQSTFNNTIITLTDPQGNVIAWGSSGTAGFKGSRKGTAYAAQRAAEAAARRGMEHGLRQVVGSRDEKQQSWFDGCLYFRNTIAGTSL